MFRRRLVVLALLTWTGSLAAARAAGPAELFQVGIYGDGDRAIDCVQGPPGSVFEHRVWAHVPAGAGGGTYVTVRLDFPANIEREREPSFHPLVTDVIVTDYVDSTEWNMILADCPSGWLEVARQGFEILDEVGSEISIRPSSSWIRDCGFVLNTVESVSALAINPTRCEPVALAADSWSAVKGSYR